MASSGCETIFKVVVVIIILKYFLDSSSNEGFRRIHRYQEEPPQKPKNIADNPDQTVPDTMVPPCNKGETFRLCEERLQKIIELNSTSLLLNRGTVSNYLYYKAKEDYDAFQRCKLNPNVKCEIQSKINYKTILFYTFLFMVFAYYYLKNKRY